MIRVSPDGAMMAQGAKVGHIVRSGRQIGGTLMHGFAVNDLAGHEVFWAAHWGDAVKVGGFMLKMPA